MYLQFRFPLHPRSLQRQLRLVSGRPVRLQLATCRPSSRGSYERGRARLAAEDELPDAQSELRAHRRSRLPLATSRSPQSRPSRPSSSLPQASPSWLMRPWQAREPAVTRPATSETAGWRAISDRTVVTTSVQASPASSRPRTRPCRRRSRPTALRSLRSGQPCTLPVQLHPRPRQVRARRAWTPGRRRPDHGRSRWRPFPSAKPGSPLSRGRTGHSGGG